LDGLPAVVIPNGVDLGRFAPAAPNQKRELRRKLGWPEGFAMLSTSRLTQDKRVGDLLSDFLGVWPAVAGGLSARLYIAGTGSEEAALRARALRAGTGNSVVFLGAREDLDTLYRAADAFLLPTASEGLSNSLLEAMACGLPVLATRVSGTEGVVVRDGENGLLYDPGRLDDLEEKIQRLLGDSGLASRLGREARHTAEDFSLDKTVERWLELYRDPVGG
jgi:glycosyltransferase involved in cell wall biosynthesis